MRRDAHEWTRNGAPLLERFNIKGWYHNILFATARALHQGRCTPHASCRLTEEGGLIAGSPFKLEQEE